MIFKVVCFVLNLEHIFKDILIKILLVYIFQDFFVCSISVFKNVILLVG